MHGITVEERGAILIITLDRPKANAIDAQTSRAMYDAFSALSARDDLRVAIISAAGDRLFSAGWDLKAAAEGEAHDADHGPGGFAGLTELFERPKPVIAAVNGSAYGGGVELMMAADLVVASSQARFAFPESTLGILPDAGGLTRLPALLPRPLVLELLLTGRVFTAEEAHAWGMINRVVAPELVLSSAVELAQSICLAAPLSVSAILQGTRMSLGLSDSDAFAALRRDIPLVASMGLLHDRVTGWFTRPEWPAWS